MGNLAVSRGTSVVKSPRGTLAAALLVAASVGIALIARQQQRAIGAYAVKIYDRAFISTQFIDAAELAFQTYAAARLQPGAAPGASRPLLKPVLDNLDVARERAAESDLLAASLAIDRQLAALDRANVAGAALQARLRTAGDALHSLSRQAWSRALRLRDKIEIFEAHADTLLLLSISASTLLTLGVSALLRRAVRQRQLSLADVAHMAQHDTLTDLPNRRAFVAALKAALEKPGAAGCAVLAIDLDRFKPVNDTLGHPVGDALLVAVAGRLCSTLRSGDMAARLGGDEFAVITEFAGQPDVLAALSQRIIAALSATFEMAGHKLAIGASIGIATSRDGADADTLLRKSDLALYRAKHDGRGTYRFFEPGMDALAQKRRTLERDLRAAIDRNELEVHYQPLVSVQTGRISLFEALVRWNHPERGLVPPDNFIPLAEEVGLINAIDEHVLVQACREAATWPQDVGLAVNLSATHFGRAQLVSRVKAALAASGLAASRLELEITERMLLADSEATLATLHQLRDLGVRISMDDFGTGYSSLSYLRCFPFDKLKIDRSFISGSGQSAENQAIVRAIASMGKSLGISTAAEGVETREQMDRLVADGCTELQGFYFSQPCTPAEIPALLNNLEREAA